MNSLPEPAPGGLGGLKGHALCLDVDGTILDLAPRPDAVEVPPWMVPLLQRLSGKLDGAVAFVSGRRIAEVDRLFAPLQLPAIGVHGGEIRAADGRLMIDEQFCEQLALVKPMLLKAIAHMPGVMLEDKHCAIALHYRAAPERGREVLRLAEIAVAGMGPDFGVLVGKCVVELRPRHLTKGAALERLMAEQPFRGRTPIFAGDDTTDEDAFDVVNRLGGISVRVGDGAPTAATCRLSDPEQLRRWLLTIAEP
ncbi:MAG TPA: trehalose-phosphatase [Steroidobacteraceae bacterium]|nr:trehalose-phosphatase [Steroidobacteraceae bacterium]